MSALTDAIEKLREERDTLRLQLRTERAERMTVEDELASLRARVREYLAALDGGASTDFCHARECRYWRLGKSHGPCICGAVAKRERTICAESALRAEVE